MDIKTALRQRIAEEFAVIDYVKHVNEGYALEFVPKEMKTEEICKIAVAQNSYALKFVPKEMKTEEICKIAVKQEGTVLKLVPEEMKTEEICKIAVDQEVYSLKFVPKNMLKPLLEILEQEGNK